MKVTKYEIKPTGKLSKREFAEVWGAHSESKPDLIYTVALNKKGEWSCSCPRWTKNASRPVCKHIAFIKNFREKGFNRAEYEEQELPEQVVNSLSRFSSIEI